MWKNSKFGNFIGKLIVYAIKYFFFGNSNLSPISISQITSKRLLQQLINLCWMHLFCFKSSNDTMSSDLSKICGSSRQCVMLEQNSFHTAAKLVFFRRTCWWSKSLLKITKLLPMLSSRTKNYWPTQNCNHKKNSCYDSKFPSTHHQLERIVWYLVGCNWPNPSFILKQGRKWAILWRW